uniref:Pyruvate carboxyltransferase domain-containing protein n=2 Tax=Aegilops tauschii subsp. strangulata TaxID=200361 RepID=A0A453JJ71_AEGTS
SKKIEIDPPHIKKIKIKSRSIPSAPILVERRRWWRWRAKPASLPGSTPLYGQASSGNTRGAAAADPLLCSRSDRVFLYHILGEVIKAGATSLSIPVGQHTPLHEFQELIADIKENTPGIENAIISTPCHDVLGLASANTLVGVFARAKQLEVTVTVSGERVGNSSMEEVVMEIKFSRELSGDLYTGVNTQGSTMKSKMMQEQSGLHAQLHNATLGAIAHEREINLECTEMLKFERTCEIASYVDIGLRYHSKCIFTP